MIAIIDYGMGNLKSIYKALKYLGAECLITSNPEEIEKADSIVLPGVGAFRDAAECISRDNLSEAIHFSINEGKPFLGICLGMQLLFEKSLENGQYRGLGILKGTVAPIWGGVKVPHMGWNEINIIDKEDPLYEGVQSPVAYFVHSYHCIPDDYGIVSATADYGEGVTASVRQGNLFGVQFHPEKSGSAGLKILDNFRRLTV